jgi:hypothetical protein
MTKTIPVFIHVPKNGGTYIYNSIKTAARHFFAIMCHLDPYSFSGSGDFRFIYYRGEKFPLREINIQERGKTIFTIFFTDKIANFLEKYNLAESDEYSYYLDLSDDKLKNMLSDSDIFAAMIQPRGLKYLKYEIFENLFYPDEEIIFTFYFPLRDPIERLKSLFFYLKSENSKHEPTHGMYNSVTFEDFIINEAPDNWVIRQLCGIRNDDTPILEKNFLEACSLINKKNFLFLPIKEIDKMIDMAFKIYGFSFMKDVSKNLKEFLTKFNSNNKNNWTHEKKESNESFEKIYMEKLSQKTMYDYKLFSFIF